MPSVHNFSVLRETVRNHPVMVATTAATGGVLLGAFVMFQVFAPTRPPMQAAAVSKPELNPVAASTEPTTTGAAVAGDTTASADCDRQTWPNLSRVCMEQVREKNRAARVVTTDRPLVAAIESTQPDPGLKTVTLEPVAPAMASVPPPIEPVASTSAPAADPAPVALAAPEEPQPAAKVPPKPAVKKAKSKPKAEPKAVAKRDADDEDDNAVASNDDDGRDVRAVRRTDRSRRIVERWTERDYNVRSDDGDGQRRITVIRRARSGGPFEALFGIGRDDD